MQFRVLSLLFCAMILSCFMACEKSTNSLQPDGVSDQIDMRDGSCNDEDYLVGYVDDAANLDLLSDFGAWAETFNQLAEKHMDMSAELESISIDAGEGGYETPYLSLDGSLANGDSYLISIEGGICNGNEFRIIKLYFYGCRGNRVCSRKCATIRDISGRITGCSCVVNPHPSFCRLSGGPIYNDDFPPYDG